MIKLTEAAEVFRVAVEANRIKIIDLLLDAPHSVHALAEKLGISDPKACIHLKVLKKYDLVTATKVHASTYYQINKRTLGGLLGYFMSQVEVCQERSEEELRLAHSALHTPAVIIPSQLKKRGRRPGYSPKAKKTLMEASHVAS